MEKTKVLYISQEITPFLPESVISNISRHLPQGVQESDMEIRTFMPRYGVINERRNQLHEVIRLSGMNIIIDDYDHPLIIKVASIQAARMQVYFIDNEDFFHRKHVLKDKKTGKFFDDNDERALFFARGVLETVNKLQWRPDIIHCHGWFTFAVPLLLKKMYSYNTLFSDAKIVYSLYEDKFDGKLSENLKNKIEDENIKESDLKWLEDPDFNAVSKFAIDSSDAFVIAEEGVNEELKDYVKQTEKPVLDTPGLEDYTGKYVDFYNSLINK
ncbi:starch synthase [Balneicella halophila]|uniref:starch synthase n=1 Tax=Balneicella halophila TaxID=1537566 RepID=A0A7L4UNL7_BALHA|nr:glycogen/starch synthase [Balneicella halophila]PVX49928.1 starch synthase [Balneicella halophila]